MAASERESEVVAEAALEQHLPRVHEEIVWCTNPATNDRLYGVLWSRRRHDHGDGNTRSEDAPTNTSAKNATASATSTGAHVAILCHGLGAHADWTFLPVLARRLLRDVPRLQHVYRFDFSGYRRSQGELEFGGYARQTRDLVCVVDTLRARGLFVDTVIGHSMGANTALLYASDARVLPNVVNLSARFDTTRGLRFTDAEMHELREQGHFLWYGPAGLRSAAAATGPVWRITQRTVDERLALNMASRVARMHDGAEFDALVASIGRRTNTLTVHGSNDRVIPVEDARAFDRHIPAHTLHIVDGADHNYTATEHRDAMIDAVVHWLNTTGECSVLAPLVTSPSSPAS